MQKKADMRLPKTIKQVTEIVKKMNMPFVRAKDRAELLTEA